MASLGEGRAQYVISDFFEEFQPCHELNHFISFFNFFFTCPIKLQNWNILMNGFFLLLPKEFLT